MHLIRRSSEIHGSILARSGQKGNVDGPVDLVPWLRDTGGTEFNAEMYSRHQQAM